MSDVFDFGKDYDNSTVKSFSALQIPGATYYKLKEKFNTLDIIPYKIKTNKHPLVMAGKKKIGDFTYNLDIFVHKAVGPGKKTIVCPNKNYGKPCPVCEEAQKAYEAGKTKEYNLLKAKRVCFYNVIDADEPDKGIQVFNPSFFLFEKDLVDEAKNANKDGTPVIFAHPKRGYSVEFRSQKQQMGGFECVKSVGFKFIPRKDDLTNYVEKAYSFDEYIEIIDSETIEKLLYGADFDEHESFDGDEEYKTNTQPVEESEPQKPKTESETDCPYGHIFGTDNDQTPDCEGCMASHPKVWKACTKANAMMF